MKKLSRLIFVLCALLFSQQSLSQNKHEKRQSLKDEEYHLSFKKLGDQEKNKYGYSQPKDNGRNGQSAEQPD